MATSNLTKSIIDVVAIILFSLWYIIKALIDVCTPKSYKRQRKVDGDVVLVTGGGGGLGRLLSVKLAKLGATIVVWDINEKAIEETVEIVKQNGGRAFAYRCNLADRHDVYRVAEETRKKVGDIDVLINNAGVLSGCHLLDTPDEKIVQTFDVNTLAHFWTTKAFLPKMLERDSGHIITIASMAGFCGVSKLVDYCASKHAAVGFDEALTAELQSLGVHGIKTTVICPYFIRSTGMFDNVQARWLPTLSSEHVATRVVRALLYEERIVMIPATMRLSCILKLILPSSVVSMFMQALIPDAVPSKIEETRAKIKAG